MKEESGEEEVISLQQLRKRGYLFLLGRGEKRGRKDRRDVLRAALEKPESCRW